LQLGNVEVFLGKPLPEQLPLSKQAFMADVD